MTPSDTTATSEQNFIGNEVTNTTYGYYLLSSGDHVEYGNNIKDSIVPEGTSELIDTSYYLDKIPPFWNITAPWPSLGIPNDNNEFSIPAKDRYWFGWIKTVCTDSPETGDLILQDGNQHLYFWPNPNNGLIHFEQQPDHIHDNRMFNSWILVKIARMNTAGSGKIY